MKKMKKILLLIAAAIMTCSCVKQLTAEEMNALVKDYCDNNSSAETYLQALRENPDQAFDYMTIFTGKAFKHVSTYEETEGAPGRYVTGELKGRKDASNVTLIAARIDKDNFANCAAAADVAKAIRELKLKPKSTFRVLFYEGETPAAIRHYLKASMEAGNTHFLNMRFDTDYKADCNMIYVNEPPMIANKLQDALKPALSAFGFDHFESATDSIMGSWPLKNSFYGYDADSSKMDERVSTALMALILLN
jgi:hypothetical protein